MLVVHAHPDDETTSTGTTMAHYAADGVAVTLLTCTLGELGEVVVPELAQLAAEQGDQLGGYRIGELAAAMRILGVSDHRFLGGPGRFRDSGMVGTPGNEAPRAFWRAAWDPETFDEAVLAAVDVIREIRPQILITYDPDGGYGHPDHIMAHRVAMAAVDAAADDGFVGAGEPWQVAKVYWSAIPISGVRKAFEAAKAAGIDFFGAERAEDLQMGTPDELVTTAIDGRAFAAAKRSAMQAHASQIAEDSPFLAPGSPLGEQFWIAEYFQLVHGETGGPLDQDGRETDLFGGLDL